MRNAYMGHLIEVQNLTKTYSGDGVETPALRGVSLSIREGEFAAIMGPSGSGKSTLLHILGFLDRPTSGDYRFYGRSIEEYSHEELAHVRNSTMGFMFQTFNLLPRLTALENVTLPLMYSEVPEGEWEERAHTALRAVGLEGRMHHESSKLSGGEKQRVAIARALIVRPKVIFADEPTGNLDSKSGQTIMEILEELNTNQGHTILLVTHEAHTAAYAKRIIHIRDGNIEREEEMIQRRTARDHFEK